MPCTPGTQKPGEMVQGQADMAEQSGGAWGVCGPDWGWPPGALPPGTIPTVGIMSLLVTVLGGDHANPACRPAAHLRGR